MPRSKIKTCYYELLDIEPDATEDQIRQAYKYQALRWHPDKNQSDPEAAADMFRDIQAAYAVLMDPKKRVWYDKFRDRILQGQEDIADDVSIDLEQYMTTTCYTGFGDDENGFYTVYRKVFEELMREELPYEEEDDVTPPGFGNSTSDYNDVHAFYSYWSSFCTKKTFDHLMKYDVLEAPNRRTLRAMEKENVKIREMAKKMRNDSVRKLVAFIRKRDKRVIEHRKQLEQVSEENRKKTEKVRMKHLASRDKPLKKNGVIESEWASMKSLERSLAALERRLDREQTDEKKNESENESDEEDDIIILSDEEKEPAEKEENDESQDEDETKKMFCVACDKCFKSRPAFDNHSKSKKHNQNVEALKKALLEDQTLLGEK